MTIRPFSFGALALGLALAWASPSRAQLLEVSTSGHYLQLPDGTPFLWVGDTAWGLSERLSRADVDDYFNDRAGKGFNATQICLFWGKRDGVTPVFITNPTNYYGHRALKNVTPEGSAEPDVVAGGSPTAPNDYWDHVDYIVDAAASRGLYLALLPVWGRRYVNATHQNAYGDQSQVVFTTANAKSYGEFLGGRYSGKPHIIWVIGGDVSPEQGSDKKPVYRLMAEGLLLGATGQSISWDQPDPAWSQVVMTYHPAGSQRSSTWFHSDPWLTFNMIETHTATEKVYPFVNADYNLTNPVKPTVLAEGKYEDTAGGALEIRRQAYQTFFAGGAGHTYGSYLGDYFWSFVGDWRSALSSEGAMDIVEMKDFLGAREWWTYVPDQGIMATGESTGELRKAAVGSLDGDEILVYFADNSPADIVLDRITAAEFATGSWFDPRDGGTQPAGIHATSSTVSFTPPGGWEDAVLVLEAKVSVFVAEPTTIAQGGISTLTWLVSGGTNVTLNGQAVAASGSMPVAPPVTTTYTLTADTPGGPYSEQATVTVGDPALLTSIEISPRDAGVLPDAVQGFVAQGLDQYGNPIAATIAWTVSGGGALDPASGNVTTFTSGGTEGTFDIAASSGGVQGAVTFTVTPVLAKVNCGPNTPVVAGWEPDDPYVSGGADFTFPGTADTSGVADAAPADVYKTCRHQDHSYDFPSVPDGAYTVRLHFYDESTTGLRAMDYTIEGQNVLDDFSIVAEAGTGTALVKEFMVTVSDGNGLQIVAEEDTGNDAFDSGVEIIATGAPQADGQAPTVSVVSPRPGATVDGVVAITGTASDDDAVAAVEVSLDGGAFELAAGTDEWTYAVDTAGLADGAHTVTLRVTDGSGNTSEATLTLNVRVAPEQPDDGGGCAPGRRRSAQASAVFGALLAIFLGRRRDGNRQGAKDAC